VLEKSGAGVYRYGFNGKENDNDVKGEGNQQDYGMRIYDPRVGRFLSVDPLVQEYPELTPYQFGTNNPILNIDLDGMEGLKGAFAKGIEFYPFALHQDHIPATTYARADKIIETANYILTPQYKMVGKSEVLQYYLAANVEEKYRLDYIVAPEAVSSFIKSESNDGIGRDTYSEVADDLHSLLNQYDAYGAGFKDRFIDYATQDKGGAGLTVDVAIEEWKNPVNLLVVASGFVAVGENAIKATPYERPTDATTPAQRASVQNKPCVTCGTDGKMYADHKTPLVVEQLKKGKIDRARMKSVDAVQSQCPTCSSRQGQYLKTWSQAQRKKTSVGTPPVKGEKKDH
jgi:RHS repeat-associated protein